MQSIIALLAALATAAPPTPAVAPAPQSSVGCVTRGGAARAGYSLAALLVVSIALSRRSKADSEPLSEEQREKFRNIGKGD